MFLLSEVWCTVLLKLGSLPLTMLVSVLGALLWGVGLALLATRTRLVLLLLVSRCRAVVIFLCLLGMTWWVTLVGEARAVCSYVLVVGLFPLLHLLWSVWLDMAMTVTWVARCRATWIPGSRER